MRFLLPFLLCASLLLGCGQAAYYEASKSPMRSPPASQETPLEQSDIAGGGEAQPKIAQRRIIYEAVVELVVEDFSTCENEIPKLIQQFDGYLASATIDRTQGERRSGHWVAKIPVDRYQAFLEQTAQLGVPETQTQTAQDVTEEYMDLETRIANQKKLEARLLELLKDPSGELKDVIEVERELARVRGEIETMTGRLRYLSNRTLLATVTIHAREQHGYTPPQAPTFTGRIAHAWNVSLKMLGEAAEYCVILFVMFVPWLGILLLIAAPAIWIWRRSRRRAA